MNQRRRLKRLIRRASPKLFSSKLSQVVIGVTKVFTRLTVGGFDAVPFHGINCRYGLIRHVGNVEPKVRIEKQATFETRSRDYSFKGQGNSRGCRSQ